MQVLQRKCAKCKKEIEIDRDNICEVVLFNKLYYHEACFKELAHQKISNRRSSPMWKEALDDELKQIKKDAINVLNYCIGRDDLCEHILSSYNVCAISSYIQMTIDSVVKGNYKGKSKPIAYRDLAQCWIDGQNTLNNIFIKNKQLGKDMTGDQRIIYDLAIVVNRFPKWKSAKVNAEKEKQEFINSVSFDDIDMSKIGQGKQVKRIDISDISDDIFVE